MLEDLENKLYYSRTKKFGGIPKVFYSSNADSKMTGNGLNNKFISPSNTINMTQEKPKYLQTIALKLQNLKTQIGFSTSFVEYSIYFSNEKEFAEYVEKAFAENPSAISYKLVGSVRTLM